MISHSFIGASLSKPHTSELNSTNVIFVAFTNKYVKNRITYIQVHEELPEQFTDAPYKAGTCITVVHHIKNYLRSLLVLYIGWYVRYGRSSHEELQEQLLTFHITLMHYGSSSHKELQEQFTDAPYNAGMFGSFIT